MNLLPDGETALSQSLDGGIRLWDMRGNREVEELAGPYQAIGEFCYSPAAEIPLFGYVEGTRKLVVTDGRQHRVVTGEKDQIYHFAFRPDGKQVVAVHYNGAADFWDVATGLRLHGLQEPTGHVLEVAFNHAGTMVATVSHDNTYRVWDAKSGRELHKFTAPSTNNGIVKIYFQPETDYLVVAQAFDGYQVVKLGEKPEIRVIKDKMMTYQLAFSPDGKRIATGGGGAYGIVVWTFPEFEQVQTLLGHSDYVSSFRFSPDGRRLASISHDKSIKLWDLESGQELLTLASPPNRDVSFSPDGRRIATAGGNSILIWDTANGHDEPTPAK